MRHPTKSRMPHKIAARLSVVRCMVLVGCCVLVFALAMGVRLAAAQTQLGEATLIATEEELGQRNESTRVYLHHYDQPILDEEGKATGEVREISRKVVEKADCLNYDIQDYTLRPKGAPIWEPAECDFQSGTAADISYEVTKGKAKVRFSSSLNDKWPITYRISERGAIYELGLGIYALAYYDASTGEVRPIEAVKNVKPVADGNHLLYSGAFSVGDLEYIYERSTFEQNLIVRNLGAVIDPTTMGMNPQSTYVGIISTLDLPRLTITPVVVDQNDAQQPLASGIAGDQLALPFKDAKGKNLFTFDRSEAWDSTDPRAHPSADPEVSPPEPTPPEASKPIRKQITLLSDGSARLFEGVPYNWLISAERQLPVTLDYLVRTGTANGNEAWQSGVTYFISDNYTVPSGRVLAIEGGAIVKLNGGKRITIASGAKLLATGSKFDYIFITVPADNSVGEPVSGIGGRAYGIQFSSTTSTFTNESEIKYCKFRYQNPAIGFLGNINLAPEGIGSAPIAHCIFCSVTESIRFSGNGSATAKILNCLFAGVSTTGIAVIGGSLNFEMKNCTFRDHNYGFYAADELYVVLNSYNNLFTCTTKSFAGEPDLDVDESHIDYCAFYATNPGDFIYQEVFGPHNIFLEESPYNTTDTQNGIFYIGDIVVGADHVTPEQYFFVSGLENGGDNDADNYGLGDKTVCAPVVLTDDNINVNEYNPAGDNDGYIFRKLVGMQEDIYHDTGTVDIGFHYDVVNAVFQGNEIQLTTPDSDLAFVIRPGATMSYHGSSTQLIVTATSTSAGYLEAQGTVANPILFTSTHMTGDGFSMPASYHYANAIHFRENAIEETIPSPESRIEFCEFNRAQRGIWIQSSATTPFELNYPIANCVFERNYNAVYLYYNRCNRIDILNCLFVANENAGVYTYYWYEQNNRRSFLNLEGNTFSQNTNAVVLHDSNQGTAELRAVVEDNIFSGNNVAVATAGSGQGEVYDVTRNNIFWNNGTDIQQSALDISDSTNKTNTNPLFCDRSLWFQDLALSLFWNDGYFLVQRSGDASRRAYRVETVVTGISDVNDIEGMIYVGVSEGIPSDPWFEEPQTFKGFYFDGYFSQGTQQGSGPTWIAVQAEKSADLGSNPYFKLTTPAGSIWVYLPPNIHPIEEEAIALFLTEDGSTYWGNTSKQSPQGYNFFNQDAYYAERWADNNLARCAYYGRYVRYGSSHEDARSPAIDTGSRDFLNSGYTSTDVGSITFPDLTDVKRDNPCSSNEAEAPDTLTVLQSRMDIGYHYFGSMRHPKEEVDDILDGGTYWVTIWNPEAEEFVDFPVTNIIPDINEGHRLAIASGNYTYTTAEDRTLICFATNEHWLEFEDSEIPPFTVRFVGWQEFRTGNMGIMTEILPYFRYNDPPGAWEVYNGGVSCLGMTAADYMGNAEIYSAISICWGNLMDEPDSSQIRVFHYDPAETPVWQLIGWRTVSITEQRPQPMGFFDVALAGYGPDVWVFWTYHDPNEEILPPERIEGCCIVNAVSNPSIILPAVPLRSLNRRAGNFDVRLDADWDDQLESEIPGVDGLPRIVWYDQIEGGYEDDNVVRSARVILDDYPGSPTYKQPDDLAQRTNITTVVRDYTYPGFTVNKYDRDDPNLYQPDSYRAYSCFQHSTYEIEASDLEVDVGDQDQWQDIYDIAPSENNPRLPDVTYRAFAEPRYCYYRGIGGGVYTTTELISTTVYARFPRLTTNQANRSDIFLAHSDYDPFEGEEFIVVYEIDP